METKVFVLGCNASFSIVMLTSAIPVNPESPVSIVKVDASDDIVTVPDSKLNAPNLVVAVAPDLINTVKFALAVLAGMFPSPSA